VSRGVGRRSLSGRERPTGPSGRSARRVLAGGSGRVGALLEPATAVAPLLRLASVVRRRRSARPEAPVGVVQGRPVLPSREERKAAAAAAARKAGADEPGPAEKPDVQWRQKRQGALAKKRVGPRRPRQETGSRRGDDGGGGRPAVRGLSVTTIARAERIEVSHGDGGSSSRWA
jgi:hypothetical protein